MTDPLAIHAERIRIRADYCVSQRLTRTYLVDPFLRNVLGWDTGEPSQVRLDYAVDPDLAEERQRKVDYALHDQDWPVILVDAYQYGTVLDATTADYIHQVAPLTPAQFAIVTDGAEWLFYADLEDCNRLCERPFLRFDSRDPTRYPSDIETLQLFERTLYKPLEAMDGAQCRAASNEVLALLQSQMTQPSARFLSWVMAEIDSHNDGAGDRDRIERAAIDGLNRLAESGSDTRSSDRAPDRQESSLPPATAPQTQQAVAS